MILGVCAHAFVCVCVCVCSPVHNTTQPVNAADARIESKSIPMYIDPFYPPHSTRCVVL